MTNLTKMLDDLDAKAKAATPGPVTQWPRCKSNVYAVIGGDKQDIAEFSEDIGDLDDEDDEDNDFGREAAHANAAEYVALKNSSPALSRIVRAAVERPWWRSAPSDYGTTGKQCSLCGAWSPHDLPHGMAHGAIDGARAHRMCDMQPLDAALDDAEAEAANG